jgi:hypothetical protein
VPRYRNSDIPEDGVQAITIDSTGLKRFGRGEWHNKKYELSSKASWRIFHAAVNQNHYFEACKVTDRFCHDDSQVEPLLEQIKEPINQFTGDGAYDESPVYEAVIAISPNAEVVIPPRANVVVNDKAAALRNRNIREIEENGRMQC